ncbi:HisA/HisF-related TIM barrel protein [Fulvimarina endophytica]|nr:HisA/HisF-related TIM barrel protein [Fulvimarina endophytica]
MQLIPVIDLMNGLVVKGRGGERESYRPIETPLAESADATAVVAGLRRVTGANVFYIADLDAIMHQAPQRDRLCDLIDAFPEITFWLDGGFRSVDEADAFLKTLGAGSRMLAVLGTETLCEQLPERGAASEGNSPFVLSLDYGPEGYRGLPEIREDADRWPSDVVLMSMRNVGRSLGPDFERLAEVRRAMGNGRLFAAGGVRGEEDLRRLGEMGIAGALVASALHSGAIRVEPERGA